MTHTLSVFANSSWHWLTSSPLAVLPFAIVFTLAIETFAVVKFGKASNWIKVLVVICIANLASFLLPYIVVLSDVSEAYGQISVFEAIETGPYYIVAVWYLAMTIIVELPITYIALFKSVASRSRLVYTIIVANIVTTALVALCERLICVGQW